MSETREIEQALSIWPAVSADPAALARLAEATLRRTFAADNTREDMDAHCASTYGTEIQRTEIEDETIDTLVAADDDAALIAYAQVRPGAPRKSAIPEPTRSADWSRSAATPSCSARTACECC